MSFQEEIKDYSIDDIELIITDQQSLYSAEELEQLRNLLKEKLRMRVKEQRIREKEKILECLPKIIICPKCDGPNAFTNKECKFCKVKLDKESYYRKAGLEPPQENTLKEKEKTTIRENSYTFHMVISFLIPLIGFIVGAVMLANDDKEKSSTGKWCIIWGIIGMLVAAILSGVLIGVGLW